MSDETRDGSHDPWHRRVLEPRSALFAVLSTLAISVGGLVEIAPMFTVDAGPEPMDAVKPLTALEVAGRDIYIREGCYVCHSQMIRPLRSDTLRYGEWTRAGEYQYDHPFLMGSRRIGPDLQRVGGKYPDSWHYEHLENPRSTSPGSIMPTYGWLLTDSYDPADIQASMRALSRVGVPYTDADIDNAPKAMADQGQAVVDRLATAKIASTSDKEVVALIAYLQRLGVDGKKAIAEREDKPSQAAEVTP